LCVAARVLEPALLANKIGQLAAVDELAAIQQSGNIGNGKRCR